MRYSKKLLAVVAGFGISACATPDMTDFAKQTATLQTAIAAEHQEIASQYDESIRLADQGKAESWFPTDRIAMAYDPAKLRVERKQVAEYAMQVDQLMASVSAYTTSLVNLAAQGETGKDAVDQAFGSVTSITALAGPAVQIPAGFVALG